MNLDNIIVASDTTRMQAGGMSYLEKAAAGTAGAIVSGLGSIYNTAIYAGNKLFDAELEEIETRKVLSEVDANWGRFYDENKSVIDVLGFIGGSFIPGGLAVKGMNLARRGNAAGPVGRALGFTMRKQDEFLAKGLQDIAEGKTVFSAINKKKWASMGFGVADNVLQSAVFEVATAMTMAQSPVLADENWSDLSWDILRGALLGGAIGGGIEALWTNGIYRQAGKAIDKASRQYDVTDALEKLNLAVGDRAFKAADGFFALPQEVYEQHRVLPFKYNFNGREVSLDLNVGALLDQRLKATAEKAKLKMEETLTQFVKDDTTIGAPVARAMAEIISEGLKEGKSSGQLREKLLETLGNLKAIQSIGSAGEDFTKDIMYVLPGASIASARGDAAALFSSTRIAGAQGYRIHGALPQAKSGILGVSGIGSTLKEAWENGYDIAFAGLEGKVHINPNSSIFKKVTAGDDDVLRVAFNTRTKQTTDTPIVTVADVATTKNPIRANASGVVSGKYTFKFSTGEELWETDSLDSIFTTARNLWASQVTSLKGVKINEKDFALQDRLLELLRANKFQNPYKELEGLEVYLIDGGLVDASEIIDNFGKFSGQILQNKAIYAKELLKEAEAAGQVIDLTALSLKLNVDQRWLEELIGRDFNLKALPAGLTAHRPLKDYAARENVVMIYDKPTLDAANTFASPYVEWQHRVTLARDTARTAAATVFGRYVNRFLDIIPGSMRGQWDAGGVGASGFGFANAPYDDLGRVWAQDVGRAAHQTKQDFNKVDYDVMNSHFVAAVTSGNKELGAIHTRYRLNDGKLMLLDGKLVPLGDGKRLRELQRKLNEAEGLLGQSPEAANQYSWLVDKIENFTFSQKPIDVSPETYAFLEAWHGQHKIWMGHHKILEAAKGRTVPWDEDALYLPPIDTKRVPYFAFVRAAEGKVMGTSEVAMITARNPQDLQTLIQQVRTAHPELLVLEKGPTEDYLKAKGLYEYALAMNEPTLDPMLRRKGLLGDYLPTLEPQAVVEEFVEAINKRNTRLVENATQTFYSQEFAELQWLSDKYTTIEKSKLQFIGKESLKKITDPFGDYIRTALDISKRAEYTLWHQANEFVDAVGVRAYGMIEDAWKAKKANGDDWIEANKVLDKVGLEGTFNTQAEYLKAQFGSERSLAKIAVAKGNMLLANITLRLDVANSMINLISMPILKGMEVASIRNSLKKNPQLLTAFNAQMREAVPGTQLTIPSATRLMYQGIRNFFGPEKRELLRRFTDDVGSVKTNVSQFHDMMEDLALTPNFAPKKWAAKVDEWTEKGAKWSGNEFSEQLTRFVASDVMRQITQPLVDAGEMTVKEQNAFISIFVNRVHGNYITSQRPIAFQGTIGAAIGLFQTYMFNTFQQLFRHIEARDAKTIAVGAALQSTIFGLNGLPMFDAINTHIIGNANINEGHRDIYSQMASINKEFGDAAMYGLASAFPFVSDKMPALYTRGDLNPRHISIVPTSFADIPIVEASSRVANAVWSTGKQIVNGADLSDAFLHGLAHNGVSRPLAGFATLLAGESTTSKGSLIAAQNDMNAVTIATRMIGAKPMDESIVMNHRYRLNAYKAADRERIEALGTVIKQKIRNGDLTEDDVLDFAGRYAASGGRADQFSAALQRWTKTALESEANKVTRALQSSYGQRLLEVMGSDPLPDYLNAED